VVVAALPGLAAWTSKAGLFLVILLPITALSSALAIILHTIALGPCSQLAGCSFFSTPRFVLGVSSTPQLAIASWASKVQPFSLYVAIAG
jgi:hypothetical protein